MPKTGDRCERAGTYIDEHGHEMPVGEGDSFPPCPEGPTWWWHEELPVATNMRYQAQRRSAHRSRRASG